MDDILKNKMEEGYIKFTCNWNQTMSVIPEDLFAEVNSVRTLLTERDLIGCYENGIGFGNISIRDSSDTRRFHITGSATGHIPVATKDEYSLVEFCDIENNALWCRGPAKASSESMSHAVIYETLPDVRCVIHVHNYDIWRKAIDQFPCTPEGAKYGTPEMAEAIAELIKEENMINTGVIIMKGHEEGIITFGRSPDEAFGKLEEVISP